MIPDYLAAYTLTVNFKLVRADIEEEMLDRFLQLAKPRIDQERYALLYEKVTTMKVIDPLEQDITNFLASDVDLLNNIDSTKQLGELKKAYDEAMDSNIRIAAIEEPLIKTRESFREIAVRASICFDVVNTLKELNVNYALSFKQLSGLFDDLLHQFERSSPQQVINKITQSVFNCIGRVLSEPDRRIFAILLAFEIESAAGRLRVGEREFIISPTYGAMLVQTLTGKPVVESRLWGSKKPFDWMSEDQYLNLTYLAITHPWFGDPFERMSRDGRETQWRALCESETPELMPMPDKLDDLLTPVQKLCITRAVRGDRVIQIALAFVANVLGKR
jgi:dynein heavy chain